MEEPPVPPPIAEAHRQRALHWRTALDDLVVGSASAAVARHGAGLEPPRRVAAYRARRGEIDPSPLLGAWGHDDASTAWPRVVEDSLEFVCGATTFRRSTWGIAEPIDGEVIELSSCDLVIVPLVVVDRHGNRLGHGRGFYDRALAGITHRRVRPVLVGLAHDEQVVDELEPAPWDVGLDVVVTPSGLWWVRAART